MKTGLILIDIQNDYFPGGKMELVGMEEASDRAARLLKAFREQGRPTFHIQHVFEDPGAPFFLPDTTGVEIHGSVKPLAEEKIIVKHYPNSFMESSLLDELREKKIQDLVICGAMSHMCVDATTRAAADLGFNCFLAHDACATRDLEFQGKRIPAAEVHGAYMAALDWGYAKVDEAVAILEDL